MNTCGKYGMLFVAVCLVAIALAYIMMPLDLGTGRKAKLFSDYPTQSKFKLSSDNTIEMPWHIYEAQHAVLVGEAHNPEPAYTLLRDLGLYPLLTSNNLPIVAVGIVEYEDSAAGAYNEMYVSFVATQSPPMDVAFIQYLAFFVNVNPFFKPFRSLFPMDGVTLVVWKMYVTTELSLLGGREIWGYPKELADIKITHSLGKKKVIESGILTMDGTKLMEVSQKSSWPFYSEYLPVYLDGRSATSRTVFHSIGESKGQVLTRMKLFNPSKDTFYVNESTPVGKQISSLQISPWLWFDMPLFEVVLFPPFYVD